MGGLSWCGWKCGRRCIAVHDDCDLLPKGRRLAVASLANFEHALIANTQQDPQLVADAVANLVTTPTGERPLRTVVDKLGLGDPIEGYNGHLAELTTGIYNAFGMAHMLQLKTH